MLKRKNKPAFSEETSDLVRLFFERSTKDCPCRSPEEVMESLVEALHRNRIASQELRVQRALKKRNVVEVDISHELKCDGLLEPIGVAFADGFRIRLKSNSSAARARFSLAHEICHTFFYEIVPELKFYPHQTDEAEERLCNFGAAGLLIPAGSLRSKAKKLSVCLASLRDLADYFGVSIATMLIRLRVLKIWQCELSAWHRSTNGNFTLDRLYGGVQTDWMWEDTNELERIWRSGTSVFGTGFVHITDRNGARRYRPVSYNMQRFGDSMIALWGPGIRKPSKDHPLFKTTLKAS
jgi:Zn-dependent peptidase ImmA (M78 family)